MTELQRIVLEEFYPVYGEIAETYEDSEREGILIQQIIRIIVKIRRKQKLSKKREYFV